MRDFRQLAVWQKSHTLVLDVYKFSRQFPAEERFHLTDQLRRAAASVPTNIAEGCGRGSDPDFIRFLHIALGSACEVEYHILLCHDLGYLRDEDNQLLNNKVNEVKRMLSVFIERLKAQSSSR